MASQALGLIEHYVCCGAGPTLEPAAASAPDTKWHDLPYKPAVLAELSAHATTASPPPPLSAVAAFCLPGAVRITRHAHPVWWPPHFGCFVITQGDGSRLFGHCLTTQVRLPSETQVQRATASTTADSVTALGGGDIFYAPRCFCLLSRAHHPLAFKACLLAMHEMASRSTSAALPLALETCLTHLVLNVPRPVPGGPTVRFALGNGAPPLHVSCAPPDALPSTEYSMAMLLRHLSPEMLISIFTALLLERQVVLVSDDDELRLGACELLQLLIHPLEWVQVYVPTIPDDLLSKGLLQNPFPCLLGLRAKQRAALPNPTPEQMVIVDLDAGEIVGPSVPTPAMPPRETAELIEVVRAERSRLETLEKNAAQPQRCATPLHACIPA